MQVVEYVDLHGELGLHKGVVALVEHGLRLINVALWGQSKSCAPIPVGLAMRERKQVLLASQAVERKVYFFCFCHDLLNYN